VITLLLAFLIIRPPPGPHPFPLVPLSDLPALVSVYDPALGGANCDSDCSTVATGPFEPEMYGTAAACPAFLLGATVDLPGLGLFECVDRGSAVSVRWSEVHQQYVIVFDLIWSMADGVVPEWAYGLWTDWSWQWE
jgi:hypothetical protein